VKVKQSRLLFATWPRVFPEGRKQELIDHYLRARLGESVYAADIVTVPRLESATATAQDY
jgi:hypothetical protein